MVNYREAKKRGLRVFRTYRPADDGTSILMTNGNDQEHICVSNNGGTNFVDKFRYPEKRDGQRLVGIENFNDFLEDYFNSAIEASRQNVKIPVDAYFF